jgi:DNA-binding CsgD family transcriptional regulator
MAQIYSGQVLNEGLPLVIAALGHADFGAQLLTLLHRLADIEHIAVYAMRASHFDSVATASIDGTDRHDVLETYVRRKLWKADPTFDCAADYLKSTGSATVRSNLSEIADVTLRDSIYRANNIRDRALVCRNVASGTLGLTLCSSRSDFFSPQRLGALQAPLETIFSLLVKHYEFVRAMRPLTEDVAAIADVEQAMVARLPELPLREVQVCSRIIGGLCTADIATELGIGAETVVTYRKRAYARLKVASQRELLLLYLAALRPL